MPSRYKLYYLADNDDGDPKYYTSPHPVKPGDVIKLPETQLYHRAIRCRPLKINTRLELSKSAQSAQEAMLLSQQYGHWPAT